VCLWGGVCVCVCGLEMRLPELFARVCVGPGSSPAQFLPVWKQVPRVDEHHSSYKKKQVPRVNVHTCKKIVLMQNSVNRINHESCFKQSDTISEGPLLFGFLLNVAILFLTTVALNRNAIYMYQ